MNHIRTLTNKIILSKHFTLRSLSIYKNDVCKYEMDKKRLENLIEQQFIGLNIYKSKSNCDIEKYLLQHEIDELTKIKNNINLMRMTHEQLINEHKKILEMYTNYLNKINKTSRVTNFN
jgi:hypothetical protein